MFQRLQALGPGGSLRPLAPGAITSQPAYFVPLGPGAGGGVGVGRAKESREECSVSSGFMDGYLRVRGKGPWAVPSGAPGSA